MRIAVSKNLVGVGFDSGAATEDARRTQPKEIVEKAAEGLTFMGLFDTPDSARKFGRYSEVLPGELRSRGAGCDKCDRF